LLQTQHRATDPAPPLSKTYYSSPVIEPIAKEANGLSGSPIQTLQQA
jgi:hypothetical protein